MTMTTLETDLMGLCMELSDLLEKQSEYVVGLVDLLHDLQDEYQKQIAINNKIIKQLTNK